MKSVLTGNLETTYCILNQMFLIFSPLNFEQFVLGPKRCLAFICVVYNTSGLFDCNGFVRASFRMLALVLVCH